MSIIVSKEYEENKKKYENDPGFNSLVNTFLAIMNMNEVTFSEMKDALIFAGIEFEMKHIGFSKILKDLYNHKT